MSNVVKLKHGKLNECLLICNKAWRLTLASLEADGFDMSKMRMVGGTEMLLRYAYYSYLMYCKQQRKNAELDEFEFDELLNVSEVEESNLEEVFGELTNSIINKVGGEVSEEQKKTLPTTN